MSSYYYVDDPKSELGCTPIPEEEFINVILAISRKHGLEITDEMILREFQVEKPKLKSLKKPQKQKDLSR